MNSLRLLSDWPWPLGFSIALALALAAWWMYRRETQAIASYKRWLLPLLRSAAIFLLMLTFLEPVIHHRVRQGNPGRITFLIDGSQSMSVLDDPKVDDGPRKSRFNRAVNLLLRNEQLSIEKLSEEFEVTIRRIDDGQVSTLWESNAEQISSLPESPSDWSPAALASRSALGDALAQSGQAGASESGTSDALPSRSVVVLLSDGQSNSGVDPLQIASQASNQAIFAVGYGATAEATDLAIQSVECPPRVFRTDTLRGTLHLKDRIGIGKAFVASLTVADEVVWQRKLTAENITARRVEFSLPTATLYELLQKKLPPNVKYAVLPLHISAQLTTDVPEANLENNRQVTTIAIAAQRSQLLLLDGRSRWENRYLRNMFDRDPAWQVNSQVASETADFQFPNSRDELFQYDLVLLGDLPGKLLTREHIQWLREFVELNGGGLILVTGARRSLAQPEYAELQKLFPVTWSNRDAVEATASQRLPKRVELTSGGQALPALRMDARGESESQALWSQLPNLQFIDRVEVLPGAEVLATAISELESQPLLVTRRFGAGRVLFSATDETWRWRYKVADVVHQRLWNQLSRWVMRTPMAVQGEFVSLDCGEASYAFGKNVELRAQLRDKSGLPASGKSSTALLSLNGEVVARVPLLEDPNVPATYSASVASLPAGDFDMTLEAAGFSREALDVHANFAIVSPPSVEMQRTVCDDQRLRALAEKTGGKYLPEKQADQLFPLLRPLSSGRFVESDTILWQTYWWFTAAMILLVTEWWLRKRAGLI
jgi:uncharacterized membrane protein